MCGWGKYFFYRRFLCKYCALKEWKIKNIFITLGDSLRKLTN